MKELLLKIFAPLVAILSTTLKMAIPKRLLGYEGWHWNPIRRFLLPPLDRLKRDNGLGYSAYKLDEAEYAGKTSLSPREVGIIIAESGGTRMPLSALKRDPDGDRIEKASWAVRESVDAEYQLHIMLFEREDGGTDVYAHYEKNAYNPNVAYEHYRGVGMDYAKGVEKTRQMIPKIEN